MTPSKALTLIIVGAAYASSWWACALWPRAADGSASGLWTLPTIGSIGVAALIFAALDEIARGRP